MIPSLAFSSCLAYVRHAGIIICVLVAVPLLLAATPSRSLGTSRGMFENGFVRPDLTTFTKIAEPVREYFYYRKQAVITGNVRVIWAHYPDIQKSADFTGTTGVGHEAIMVNSYRPLRPFDGDIASEQYAPLRAKVEQGKIIVLLHGSELYMYGAPGHFDQSGGEFEIKLFLRDHHGTMTIVKTEELLQP